MSERPNDNPLLGVALVMAAVFLFALTDILVKSLTDRFSPAFIQAMRYIVNLALVFLFMFPRHGARLWHTKRTGLVLLRGLVLGVASLTMAMALRVLPVGEAVAIVYLAPFAVMLLSGPLLAEKVRPAAWFGATLAFSGVLLVMRPGGGLDPVGVTFAVINAALSTAYHLMTRILTRTESTMAMLFHVALTGGAVLCVMAIPTIPTEMPEWRDLLAFLALGGFATGGHFLFTIAYRIASPSLLAPVNYVQIVWAALLSWVFFNHVPDPLSLSGMGMVLLAGMGLALLARRPRNPVMRG